MEERLAILRCFFRGSNSFSTQLFIASRHFLVIMLRGGSAVSPWREKKRLALGRARRMRDMGNAQHLEFSLTDLFESVGTWHWFYSLHKGHPMVALLG